MRHWTCTLAARAMALALVTAAAACSPLPSVPPSSTVADPTETSTPVLNLDGTYRGDSLPDQIVDGCGEDSHDVKMVVRGDRVTVHHGRHPLIGTVDDAGEVTIENANGVTMLSGTIQSGVFRGTETTTKAPRKLQGFYVNAQSTCTYTIQATKE